MVNKQLLPFADVGPSLGIAKSSSLESLQTAMRSVKHTDEPSLPNPRPFTKVKDVNSFIPIKNLVPAGRVEIPGSFYNDRSRDNSFQVIRGRVLNESFRAALDQTSDPSQELSTLETRELLVKPIGWIINERNDIASSHKILPNHCRLRSINSNRHARSVAISASNCSCCHSFTNRFLFFLIYRMSLSLVYHCTNSSQIGTMMVGFRFYLRWHCSLCFCMLSAAFNTFSLSRVRVTFFRISSAFDRNLGEVRF